MSKTNELLPSHRGARAIALCIAAAVLLTGIDLGTKAWAEETLSTARHGDAPEVCSVDDAGFIRYQRLPGDSIPVVGDVLELQYAENCYAAFGLFHQLPSIARRVVFGAAALIAVAAMLWLFARGRGGPFFAVSVPLVVAGALGNFFDRALAGYVVDFIHFHVGGFDYPNFNFADIVIAVGVTLLLIDGFRTEARAVAQ